MARARKLQVLVLWAALFAFFVALFKLSEGSNAPLVFIVVSGMLLATLVSGYVRARRALVRIQERLSAGDPDELLRLVDRKLRYLRKPRVRAPYLVFRAAGLSMKGEWERGLEALDEIGTEDLPEQDRGMWELGYHGARLSCLLFSERVEEARSLHDRHIEPLAERAELAGSMASIEAFRAQLWFCEGEHARSREVFEKLVTDRRIPAAGRGLFHYFLGRIFRDYGKDDEAKRHFDRAAALAPRTWIPAGIRALEE